MKFITKEILRFIMTGISAVSIDFITYLILIGFLNNDLSKAISFILGTIFSFLANKYWTFEKFGLKYFEMWRFALLYTLTMIINVLINRLVIDFFDLIFIAFIVATATSALINFLGQKFWVFK